MRHCAQLLGNSNGRTPFEKIRYIVDAKRTNTLTLAAEHNYDLMYMLNRGTGEYLATASLDELMRPAAHHFIYQLTRAFPTRIRRVFVIEDKSALKALGDDQKRALLDQLNSGCQLRFCVDDKSTVIPNIAIYGTVAVGVLQPDGSNAVNFTRDGVMPNNAGTVNSGINGAKRYRRNTCIPDYARGK